MASASGNIRIGDVTSAAVQISGSSDVTLGSIGGNLGLELRGSGDFQSGRTGATSASLEGSGSISIAAVQGGLTLSSRGSGDTEIGTVDGPVQIQLSGSGNIEIKGGQADPVSISASGSGDIAFGGVASNPQISSSGSGEICIAKQVGSIDTRGANISIGQNCP